MPRGTRKMEVDEMARYESNLPTGARAALDVRRGDWLLRYAAILYGAGFLLHSADHLRRGVDAITPEVLWAGNISSVLGIAAIALVLMGHRLGAVVAIAVGFPTALGVAAVHLLPAWGAFSDSLSDGGVDVLSWAAVLIEIGGAVALGVAGVIALRRDGRAV